MPLATPQTIAEISAAWITDVLRGAGALAAGQVVGVALRPIGESQGFLSSMAAVDLTYDVSAESGPASVVAIRVAPVVSTGAAERQEAIEQGLSQRSAILPNRPQPLPPVAAQHCLGKTVVPVAAESGPASVVVKLEPAAGAFRDAERNYKAFEREAFFYRDVAGGVDVRVPRVFYAHAGPEGSVLVMEDLTRLTCGDQVRGMRHEEVIATVRQIARVHAAYWNNDRLAALGWLPDHDPFWFAGYEEHWPGFAREYDVRLGRDGLALGEGVLKHLDWLKAQIAARPSSLVHADLRADNLLFGEPRSADAVVIVDWQLATRSMAAVDPTRLLGGSEPASQRNGHHLEVFTAWHETLLEHGVTGYEFDEALADFRLGALYNLLVPVLAYGFCVGTKSVRTGRLIDAQVERMYVSATELDAGKLLPT